MGYGMVKIRAIRKNRNCTGVGGGGGWRGGKYTGRQNLLTSYFSYFVTLLSTGPDHYKNCL